MNTTEMGAPRPLKLEPKRSRHLSSVATVMPILQIGIATTIGYLAHVKNACAPVSSTASYAEIRRDHLQVNFYLSEDTTDSN